MSFSIRDVGAVNDMPRNWKRQSELNYRIYNMWIHMIRRCYNKEIHENHPTYKNCTVQKELLYLSNFVNWIEQEEYYEDFVKDHSARKWSIDKDILYKGNKEYAIGKIKLVTLSENSSDANNRINHKENAKSLRIPIVAVNIKNNNDIKYYDSMRDAERDIYGFNHSKISSCCQGKRKSHKGYKWYYLEDFKKLNFN